MSFVRTTNCNGVLSDAAANHFSRPRNARRCGLTLLYLTPMFAPAQRRKHLLPRCTYAWIRLAPSVDAHLLMPWRDCAWFPNFTHDLSSSERSKTPLSTRCTIRTPWKRICVLTANSVNHPSQTAAGHGSVCLVNTFHQNTRLWRHNVTASTCTEWNVVLLLWNTWCTILIIKSSDTGRHVA